MSDSETVDQATAITNGYNQLLSTAIQQAALPKDGFSPTVESLKQITGLQDSIGQTLQAANDLGSQGLSSEAVQHIRNVLQPTATALATQRPALLNEAVKTGVDLRPLYGQTYQDAVQFKKDLGQYTGKDTSMIIPANPVGYEGGFKFDPNFGSAYYRDMAEGAGAALGLTPEQVTQTSASYFAPIFAGGNNTQGIIGFTDFGTGLIDKLAGAAGVPADKLPELKQTALKPLYEVSDQVYAGLNGAAKIESQSKTMFQKAGSALAGLGPIGTIALTMALGPAGLGLAASTAGAAALAGALPSALQGDLMGAIKGGAIAGIGAGALSGIGGLEKYVSNAVGGGTLGTAAGQAASGAIKGGIGSLVSGGDLKDGLLAGALTGGVTGAASGLINQFNSPTTSIDSGSYFGGISEGANSSGGLTVPDGFDIAPGVGNNLPDTLGVLAQAPGIGSLFDNMEFAQQGLQVPSVPTQDFGSGIGQGLQVPESPTLPGQLGQGLTVGVPEGTLGQGGVTPIGQVNLGDPDSYINGGTNSPPAANSMNTGNLIKALLSLGGAAGLAQGIGSVSGGDTSTGTGQPGPSNLALNPRALNRDLGFQFQAPQYTAGLGGQAAAPMPYEVINPQTPQAPSYLRGFAAGGDIQALNGGLGSISGSSGFLEGAGNGLSDDIPAVIEGEEPVRLADGEYIVPAQVVSALGNGSSKAGSRELDAMVQRVYKEQTGKPKQMKPMNPRVLPA
jgi:hypothetical protein